MSRRWAPVCAKCGNKIKQAWNRKALPDDTFEHVECDSTQARAIRESVRESLRVAEKRDNLEHRAAVRRAQADPRYAPLTPRRLAK